MTVTIGPNVIIHPSIDMIAIAMMMMIDNAPPGATSSSTLNSVPAVADHIPQALVQDGHVTKLGGQLSHQEWIWVPTWRHLALQHRLDQPAELHRVRGQHSFGVTLH